jgi:restriction system protein
MSIPDFQTMMLPFLGFFKDEKEHSIREITSSIVNHYKLSQVEIEELIPSGRQTRLVNRVSWVCVHFQHAKLIEKVRRGIYKITDRGLSLSNKNLDKIDLKFLKQFPEYIESIKSKTGKADIKSTVEDEISKTPEESLEIAYQTIRNSLASEIIDRVKSCSPYFFERLVVELLVKMGYGGTLQEASALVTRKGSDEGIDGIIKEDRLGLDVIYIQAKRWENVVGRPEIQKFVGALAGQQARKGVFITTSNFTKDAKDFADKIESKIILIDGEQLAEFMIDYNVGVSNVTSYELKRIDSDYFSED